MFNALKIIRGGEKTDVTLADNMNTALYSAFAVFILFGRTFVNRLGNKISIIMINTQSLDIGLDLDLDSRLDLASHLTSPVT
jgi:hypothetical protein